MSEETLTVEIDLGHAPQTSNHWVKTDDGDDAILILHDKLALSEYPYLLISDEVFNRVSQNKDNFFGIHLFLLYQGKRLRTFYARHPERYI